MLDSLRDTHAALNGSTPVPLDKRGILDEIIKTASGKSSKSETNGYGDDEFNPWIIGATM